MLRILQEWSSPARGTHTADQAHAAACSLHSTVLALLEQRAAGTAAGFVWSRCDAAGGILHHHGGPLCIRQPSFISCRPLRSFLPAVPAAKQCAERYAFAEAVALLHLRDSS